MLLHHLVTIYLFGFSYLSNQMIGGPVTFLHNWADVAISFTRIWSETKFANSIALPSFLIMLIIWFYTRLYVFGHLIYSYYSLEIYTKSPYMQPNFILLLCCLLMLHVYWSILFVKILYGAIFKNMREDTVTPV
jgi:very-long-chain ceramide synthase